MRNAAAKTVWPLCETPSATSMAPVGVSSTKIPPYPPATASRGVPAPMSWRISNDRLWPADVEQVSLVHVLAAPKPGQAHAAAIEVVGEGALDDLGAQLEGFLGHPR